MRRCVYADKSTPKFDKTRKDSNDRAAQALLTLGVQDMSDSLRFINNIDMLRRASELAPLHGAGYGSGKTAIRMIQAAIKRLEKKTHG